MIPVVSVVLGFQTSTIPCQDWKFVPMISRYVLLFRIQSLCISIRPSSTSASAEWLNNPVWTKGTQNGWMEMEMAWCWDCSTGSSQRAEFQWKGLTQGFCQTTKMLIGLLAITPNTFNERPKNILRWNNHQNNDANNTKTCFQTMLCVASPPTTRNSW